VDPPYSKPVAETSYFLTQSRIFTSYVSSVTGLRVKWILNYWGVHPVARVSSNVNKPPYATVFFGARFYCALTLHVSAPDW
jgi:hypothetical protein